MSKLGIENIRSLSIAANFSRPEIKTFSEQLKFKSNCDKDTLPCPNYQQNTIHQSYMREPIMKQKSVTFNHEVKVVPIPMRKDYSQRISNRLWFRSVDRFIMRKRNKIEFAAEGRDWHQVLEEDKMYLCIHTKELIHPVHVSRHESFTAWS